MKLAIAGLAAAVLAISVQPAAGQQYPCGSSRPSRVQKAAVKADQVFVGLKSGKLLACGAFEQTGAQVGACACGFGHLDREFVEGRGGG